MASASVCLAVFLFVLIFADVRCARKERNSRRESGSEESRLKREVVSKGALLKSLIKELNALKKKFSTNYVRWGRNVCPGDAEKLYFGHMATSASSHSGGGSNYLCFTDDQEDIGGNVNQTFYSELWSVVYKNVDNSNLEDKIAPCAVCVVDRGQQIMIPGRSTCYPGWTKEYAGVIMANAYTDYKSEFICLDQDPQGIPGPSGTLYHVETHCEDGGGVEPCHPFANGGELPCVICTKNDTE